LTAHSTPQIIAPAMICFGPDGRVEELNVPTQAKSGLEWGTR